jgi:trimethylamine--corrinoid protein Co-methyltransferase
MRDVCLTGPGHYLGSEQTLGVMQTEYVYPATADRTSPKEWEEKGKPDLLLNATARKEEILSKPSDATFDPVADAAIRERFKIHLQS